MFNSGNSGAGLGFARLKPRSEIREDLSGESYTQQLTTKKTKSKSKTDVVAAKIEEFVKAIVKLEGYDPANYPEELEGSQSRNLIFEGILVSGYQSGQAVKRGTPNKYGIAVGYQLKWLGDEPLHYVYSVALDAKAKKDSLMDMTVEDMDIRVVEKGQSFCVTRLGIAMVLHQPKFNGKCSPGVMLDANDDYQTTNETLNLIYHNVTVPYLRHSSSREVTSKGGNANALFAPKQKPIKDYPIYIAERDGLLDSEERVNIPLKPEYEEQFGACRSKSKRRRVNKANTRKKVERLAADSMLINEIYNDNR